MSNSPGGSSWKLKDSYPQSGNTAEGFIEEPSYQNHHQKQKQKQQQQPLAAGISPEQFHPKDKSLQSSAIWVSPKQDDHCSTPQQQLLSAPQHPSNNNYSLPSSRCSDQKPDHQSAGVPSRNVSYEEFIALEERQSCSSTDPKTGFPKTWPEVSSPSPANVTSTLVQQPSSAKVLPPPAQEASPSNVSRTFPPPSSHPPRRFCSCCIIL